MRARMRKTRLRVCVCARIEIHGTSIQQSWEASFQWQPSEPLNCKILKTTILHEWRCWKVCASFVRTANSRPPSIVWQLQLFICIFIYLFRALAADCGCVCVSKNISTKRERFNMFALRACVWDALRYAFVQFSNLMIRWRRRWWQQWQEYHCNEFHSVQIFTHMQTGECGSDSQNTWIYTATHRHRHINQKYLISEKMRTFQSWRRMKRKEIEEKF